MANSPRPWAASAALLAVQSLAPCVLSRHLADRAVQAGLFKLVPRGCCIVPAAARREGVYHSVHGFFDCALIVDVYNICHDAQLAGLGPERPFAVIRLGPSGHQMQKRSSILCVRGSDISRDRTMLWR